MVEPSAVVETNAEIEAEAELGVELEVDADSEIDMEENVEVGAQVIVEFLLVIEESRGILKFFAEPCINNKQHYLKKWSGGMNTLLLPDVGLNISFTSWNICISEWNSDVVKDGTISEKVVV